MNKVVINVYNAMDGMFIVYGEVFTGSGMMVDVYCGGGNVRYQRERRTWGVVSQSGPSVIHYLEVVWSCGEIACLQIWQSGKEK